MTSPAPVPVQEVERDDLDIWKSRSHCRERKLVRPVADADEERPRLEPDRVASFDQRRLVDLARRPALQPIRAPSEAPLARHGALPSPAEAGSRPRCQRGPGRRRRSRPGSPGRGARSLPRLLPLRGARRRPRARPQRRRDWARPATRTRAIDPRPPAEAAGRGRARASPSWRRRRSRYSPRIRGRCEDE